MLTPVLGDRGRSWETGGETLRHLHLGFPTMVHGPAHAAAAAWGRWPQQRPAGCQLIAELSLTRAADVVCHLRAGTGGLNVPMFIALRRFTLLCTIVLERVLMAKRHDRSTIGAVGVMIIGESHLAVMSHPSTHVLCVSGCPADAPAC